MNRRRRRKAFPGEWALFYLTHLITLAALAYWMSGWAPLLEFPW